MSMHPAKAMARLNAKNVRFDVGSGGGEPEITPQDIAGALGYVPAGIGLELLCHVHWPDGARRRRDVLLDLLTASQLAEHNRREQALAQALCAVAIATAASRASSTRRYGEAHAHRWPQWIERLEPLTLADGYKQIRLGVLEEMAHPRTCPDCSGRDLLTRQGQPKTCERCLGRGVVDYGATWRAARLGVTRAGFIKVWQAPYLWLLDHAVEEMQKSETSFRAAMRD